VIWGACRASGNGLVDTKIAIVNCFSAVKKLTLCVPTVGQILSPPLTETTGFVRGVRSGI